MKPAKPLEVLILTVRGRKVLLDADLASIYGVGTMRLNEQVKRNVARFPEDFRFQLTEEETAGVIANCDNPASLRFRRTRPWAFTEHGAIMAASVLSSPEAVTASVFVVRAFVQMREQLAADAAILKRLSEIDKSLLGHDAALKDVYRKLLPLLSPAPAAPRRRIGFHRADEPE